MPARLPHPPHMDPTLAPTLAAGYAALGARRRAHAQAVVDLATDPTGALLRAGVYAKRGIAARWYPSSGHGTTPVFTVGVHSQLTMRDLAAIFDGIVESGAEPRLGVERDDAGRVTHIVIGARRLDVDCTPQRSAADDMLAEYRAAQTEGDDAAAADRAHTIAVVEAA